MEKTGGDLPPSKTCGSCGRVGTDLKICNACRSVHYCDVTCQKAHRKAHKNDCKVIAHAKEVMEEFKANPMTEECPLCMLRLPLAANEYVYHPCCGKTICRGCIVASQKAQGADPANIQVLPPCAFCRCPATTSDEELLDQLNKRIDEHSDSMAINTMAGLHRWGDAVLKDYEKAFKCYVKASDMGSPYAMYNLAAAYKNGEGVQIDEKKVKISFEMAARKGHVNSLVRLAQMHRENLVVSLGYCRLAAENGHEESMENLKKWYCHRVDATSNHSDGCNCSSCTILNTKGLLTKDDLATTIRAFHSAQEELRSDERDFSREQIKLHEAMMNMQV